MGKTYFTQEQQVKLRKNPYVQKVSAKSITDTMSSKRNSFNYGVVTAKRKFTTLRHIFPKH